MNAPTPPRAPGGAGRGRPGRVLAGLLAGLLAIVLGGAGAVLGLAERSAAAVEPEPQQVSITLDRVQPTVLDRDSRLVLSGTATNSRDTPVSNLQLMLWRDQGTLYTDQRQITDLVNAPSTLPVGARVQVETAYTVDLPALLQPGESVDFELSATVTELGLPPGDGAALVGVQAREDALETVGRSRTLVPVVSEQHPEVPVASVVLLDAPPSRLRTDLFTGEELAAELAPDGRLGLLLSSAARDQVSWAVDPMLLAELADMADGYEVLSGGEQVAGTGAEVAADWLEAFDELDPDAGFRLPWAQPDVLAVARHGDEELSAAVVAAQHEGDLGPAEGLPLLVAPARGTVDAATLELIRAMDPTLVLLRGVGGSGIRRSSSGPALVDVDGGAFTAQIGPDPRESPAQITQQLASGTLLTSLQAELFDQRPAPQVRVLETPEQAALDAAASEGASWQRPTLLTDLLDAELPPRVGGLDGPAADADLVLTPEVLTSAGELLRDTRAVNGLLTDADEVTDADRTAAAAVSSWWRPGVAAERRAGWISPRTDEIADLLSGRGIVLTVAENVAMSARTGAFPVSVTNRLDRPIRVAVRFETDASQRLSIPAVEAVEIDPGQTYSTTAEARARANGSFIATARLATPDGDTFGPSQEIRIQASEIGRAGWVIVIGSGVVLVGGTVLRVRQVRRQHASGVTDASTETTDTETTDTETTDTETTPGGSA